MRKVALVFVIAVIAPSLLLAWLAVGSLRDQEVVLERQQSLLYQGVADGVAARIRAGLEDLRTEFQTEVAAMLRGTDPMTLPARFDPELRARWPVAGIGFVVALDGDVLAPSMFAGPDARRFRLENDRFLCSRESVEVYWNSPKGAISLTKLDLNQKEPIVFEAIPRGKSVRAFANEKESASGAGAEEAASKLVPEAAAFRQIVRDGESGTLARFLQDELNVLFWYRPPLDKPLVFGARVDLARVVDSVRDALALDPPLDGEIALTLMNAAGQAVAISPNGMLQTNTVAISNAAAVGWSGPAPKAKAALLSPICTTVVTPVVAGRPAAPIGRPFVSAEIGESLPHWEVGAFLIDPKKLGRSAHLARLTVGLLITLLVLAIAVGSWLIVTDLKRQLALTRQKTDFVSNVSHELKTPLTSIRMFSEMLAEGRVVDEAKRRQFLGIITAETARLTRLINNVLDFARLERGEKSYQFAAVDLAALSEEIVGLYRPHLEAGGFRLTSAGAAGAVHVRGDRDALSQVMVNLLSNAEKYAGDRKEIEVTLASVSGWIEWSVLDRGLGVPPGSEERIFEQFFRAHDSLASGVQGSGLGLTLSRQIARAHGGDIRYHPRDGGGSCFALRLPGEMTNDE